MAKTTTTIEQAIVGELAEEAARPSTASTHLYIGIDIAKNAHVAAFMSEQLIAKHGKFTKCPVVAFDNSRVGFEKLASHIALYGKPEACTVLVENTGHYGRALQQYLLEMQLEIYVMHVTARPQTHQKTDRRDAQGLANLLYNHLEKQVDMGDRTKGMRALLPLCDIAMKVQGLAIRHAEVSVDIARRKNKLTAIIDEVFPELVQVYKDTNAPSALALREAYPLPQDVVTSSLDALCKTRPHTRPSRAALKNLQDLARTSIGTKNELRQTSLLLEQAQLIAELQLLIEHKDELEEKMAVHLESSREYLILSSFPGVAIINAASLLAKIGNIRNFETPAKLRSFLGWSPEQAQTGISLDRVKLKKGGAQMGKHTMYLVVIGAIRVEPWKGLYDRLVLRKCSWDERRKVYRGKMKVIGRIAGQMIALMWTLLHEDAEIVDSIEPGQELPEPKVYDAEIHLSRMQQGKRQQIQKEQAIWLL